MAAAVANSGLLTTLTDASNSARSSFPTPIDFLVPPSDGISLLDTKNDLLLHYLQNLVFMIILKLRVQLHDGVSDNEAQTIGREAVQKLVETRAYLEKGVRPLEGRLKYQIEKVLRAADDAERLNIQKSLTSRSQKGKISRDTKVSGTSDTDTEEDSAEETANHDISQAKIDDLSYRPNPRALLHKSDSSRNVKSPSNPRSTTAYKPPRITPTSMPDLDATTAEPSRSERRNRKSHLLDEYISTELSSAPAAEPSIGSNSTILGRGRGALSTREREKQRARTEFEESNFSRLPGESKAEKRKNKGRDGRRGGTEEFGGEDWTGIGEVGDRIARSVGRGTGGGGREGTGSVLERREKRRRDDDDGGRSAGRVGIGDSFEKRRRILEGRAERKRKSA